MTPAKPQQMSGQTDDADDLIAELTKLMASEGKQSNPDSVADNAPSAQRPDAAAGARTASQPPIRIPGVSLPVGTPPQAANKFDFGRPPAAATMPAPEPLANWQAAPKPAVASIAAARSEPSFDAPVTAPIPPPVASSPPAPADDAGGFDFDFGFGSQRPDAAPPAPKPAPAAEAQAAPILSSGHDPIADLIAAELDAAGPVKTPSAAPAPRPISMPVQAQVPPAAAPEASPAPVQARVLPPISAPAAPVPSQSSAAPRPQPSAPPPLRPMSYPTRTVPPESDRFATAPVFGLGGRPSSETSAPKPGPDPMDEIENLIGEAVRVELSAPQQVQPIRPAQSPQVTRVTAPVPPAQSTPAVPPLTTQFAPRRTSLREPDPSFHGADDAILAAAADSGAQVGHVDAPFDERAFKPKKQARRERPSIEDRRPSAFRQLIVPAVAGTLLLGAGFGLYWALGMGHHDGGAPVLAADTTPSKQIPPKPAADATHSAVLDELSCKAPAPANEQLVSRDQTAGTDAAQVAAAQPAPTTTTTPAAANNDGSLANRKVRTVTVRPDGTIVSGDDTVAGAAKLPVDRPNVPAVPGAAVANADTGTDAPTAADASASTPADPAETAAVEPPVADNSAPATAATDTTAAPTDIAATTPAIDAPVPMPRPASRDQQVASTEPTSPVNAVVKDTTKPVDLIGNLAAANADTQAAAPQPEPAQPAAAATASIDPNTAEVTSAPAHAQLASQRSQADAQASANKLQSKFGSLFNNAKLQVVQADLGAKGIYYRVVLPTSSVQIAAQICAAIRTNGGDCVAING
jgi:hypothetical protein